MSRYGSVYEQVSKQKPLQTLDYDNLNEELNDLIVTGEKLQAKIKKEKFEIAGMDNLLTSLIDTALAFNPIVKGLGDKANNRGKYSWFNYRSDLKTHDTKRSIYIKNAQIFSLNIEDEVESVEVKAHISNGKIEIMEIPREDYEKFGDGKGNVYVMQNFDKGELNRTLVSKEIWDSMRSLLNIF